MSAADLLPGDFVQARMKGDTPDGDPEQWLVTEFTVTAVTSTVVAGSALYPDGLDESSGWVFEVITRSGLTLPDTLSEISANLLDGRTVTLMGRGTVWSNVLSGEPISTDLIASFTTL